MSVFHPSRSTVSGAHQISGSVHITAEGPVPSTPAAGAGGVLYTKADGKPYWKSDDIAEADLTSGSGGGGSGTITALNNQAANRLVTIGSTTTQLDGEANLTFNGSTLTLAGAMTATSLSASANISASSYYGDGSILQGVTGSGGTVTLIGLTGSNGVTITSTNTLPVTGSDQITFTLGALTPTSVSASGIITANYYVGDGSRLQGVTGSGGGGGSYTHTSSATAPGSPSTGDWWYDHTNNILYNHVTDGAAATAWVDVSTATSTLVIKDADSDTKIQVEESADEDKIRFDTAGSERMVIDQTGSIGIGVTLPSYPVHHTTGGYLSTGGAWTDASSREYKENIRKLTFAEAKAAFNSLDPVRFQYKTGKEDKVGFIAEDVPDLVATPNRQGLSSMDIVAVLTKVVQKQQIQIDELVKLLKDKVG